MCFDGVGIGIGVAMQSRTSLVGPIPAGVCPAVYRLLCRGQTHCSVRGVSSQTHMCPVRVCLVQDCNYGQCVPLSRYVRGWRAADSFPPESGGRDKKHVV